MLFDPKSLSKNLAKATQQQAPFPKNFSYDPNRIPNKSHDEQISLNSKLAFISHQQGTRPSQEDTADIYVLKNNRLANLANEVVAEILYKTIIKLGEEINQKPFAQNCGSTLITSLQIGNRVFTANIGDSKAILLKRKNKKTFTAQALNWEHKPTDQDETERIKNEGGTVLKLDVARLGGVLALSRAFGHPWLPGLSYQPDITVVEVSDNEEAYIINCCDGVTETMNELDIQDFFNTSGLSNNPASQLGKEAYLRGSSDNISVVFVPVINDPDKSILSFVADGHGRSEVAQYIKSSFAKHLDALVHEMQ
jgi:serine/threonine protein phosphatase PrpC